MARNKRGKMALYEAMSKAREKPGFGRTLEQMRQQKAHEAEAGPVEPEPVYLDEEPGDVAPEPAVHWTRKPSLVQVNAGRIEFSIPYQMAIAGILFLVLVVLVAYRAGQLYQPGLKAAGGPAVTEPIGRLESGGQDDRGAGSRTIEQRETVDGSVVDDGQKSRVPSTGAYAIVLVEYGKQRDLEPVRRHFAEYGIETRIVADGGRYFLITVDGYDSVSAAGTAGYEAKKKIAEVGALYRGKAPEGYETFAPHFFSDAYARKFD